MDISSQKQYGELKGREKGCYNSLRIFGSVKPDVCAQPPFQWSGRLF